MIIPLHMPSRSTPARKPNGPRAFEVWAFTGDFSRFTLLYSSADAPDAPAYFAAELFDKLVNHANKSVRNCELAVWSDIMPLDAKRWMFFVTTERMSDEIMAVLNALTRGTKGWCPVGPIRTLPESAVPLYEYEKGMRYLLLSDVKVGEEEESLAHPMVDIKKDGLHLGFGVFPPGYLNENKLYLGTGGGICFTTKSAQGLRPGKVYCLLPEKKEAAGNSEPPETGPGNGGLRLVR